MFETVMAIVLISYFLLKFVFGKINKSANDYRSKQEFSEKRGFYEQYCIPNEEYGEFRRKKNNRDAEVWEEMKSIREELRNVIGMEPTEKMVEWAYAAKRGKLLERIYHIGVGDSLLEWRPTLNQLRSANMDYSTVPAKQPYSLHQMAEAHLRFMQWYDKTLRDHGMTYRLMVAETKRFDKETRDAHYSVAASKYVEEAEPSTKERCYFWWPLRHDVDCTILRSGLR